MPKVSGRPAQLASHWAKRSNFILAPFLVATIGWKRHGPQSSTRHPPFPLVNRAEPWPLFTSRTFRVTEQGPGNEEGSVSDIRIGICGWRYGPWRKDFYPKGLPQDDELAFASRAVNTFDEAGFARFLELLPHSDVELYSSGYTAQALRRSLDHELMSEPGVVPEVAL
ncbi:hypothetical protein D3C75_646120 [compost metagenome]